MALNVWYSATPDHNVMGGLLNEVKGVSRVGADINEQ